MAPISSSCLPTLVSNSFNLWASSLWEDRVSLSFTNVFIIIMLIFIALSLFNTLRQHSHPVFCKCKWHDVRMFHPFELVPNWHQFIPFLFCEYKHKLLRKTPKITPYLSF